MLINMFRYQHNSVMSVHFECMFIVQERVEALNEKLDLVLSGGEKLTDGELSAEGGPIKPGYGKKPCKLPIDRL